MVSFPKSQRLCSRKSIDALFSGSGTRAMTVFPIRMVYGASDGGSQHQVLMSVSKRHFKNAVHRNRVKRQLREAYRHHKQVLDTLAHPLHIAFIWLSDELFDTQHVDKCVQRLLERLVSRMQTVEADSQ